MSVSIVILGDICPEDGFPELFASGSADSVFTDIISVLAEADYVVANLEAPVTLSNKKLYKNSVCLKSNPSDVHVLREAGINAVALANNHIVDYDTDGVIDTFTYLSAQNIEFYGAGDVNKAAKPHFANVKGKKLFFWLLLSMNLTVLLTMELALTYGMISTELCQLEERRNSVTF